MLIHLRFKALMCSDKGVSLVEFMVATVIAIVAFGSMHMSFSTGDASYRANETKIVAQRAARQAMDNMTRELRGGSNIAITQDANTSQISFNLIGIGTITYIWSNSGGSANQILRNGVKIIGNKISALSFNYNGSDTVTINLTATESRPYARSISVSLQENVTLRLL